MADKQVDYQTLKEVREAFKSWESEGKAFDFAWHLWKTAEKLVHETSKEYLTKVELAKAVGLKLHHFGCLTVCITDDLRRLMIKYHARGVSTTAAVESIIMDDAYRDVTPFYLLKHGDVCGYENIKNFLVGRLSYLKPSHPRWPEKKYGKLWKEERSEYVDKIRGIPLTQPEEQLQELSDHYIELKTLFQNADKPSDKERYHKCMMRVQAGIYQMTRDPAYKSLSKPNIQGNEPVALPKPEQEDIVDIPAQSVSQS